MCEELLNMSESQGQFSEKIAILAAGIENLEKKIEAEIERTQKQFTEKTDNLAKNIEYSVENKVFRNFFNFLGAYSLILAVAGVFAYKVNADSFNALKENLASSAANQKEKDANSLNVLKENLTLSAANQKEKFDGLKKEIEERISGEKIEGGFVRSATNDDNMQGYIAYQIDSDNANGSFKLIFNLPFRIDVRGKGVASAIGLKLTMDKNLGRILNTNPDGSTSQNFYDLTKEGKFYNFQNPISIMEGLSYEYIADWYIHRLTCVDVKATIADIVGKSYDIEARPFIAKTTSETHSFHVTFVEDSFYQCKK